MLASEDTLVESPHGIACRMGTGERTLLGFQGTWMALTREQLAGVGNAISNILNCPFKDRHLQEGMLLRSKDGNRRLPLTEATARELHALVNDTLLILDAQDSAREGFGDSEDGHPSA